MKIITSNAYVNSNMCKARFHLTITIVSKESVVGKMLQAETNHMNAETSICTFIYLI